MLENLAFANGVILSDDESFILVAESLACRIIKYYLKGPKAGQHEIFIEGLPGVPDNLQSDGQGGFLVTTVITINSEHPQFFVTLVPHPYLRKMFVRSLLMFELPFKLLHDIYPSTFTEKVMHAIGSYHVMGKFWDSFEKSFVLRIDASGNIMEVLSSDDNTISGISEAHIHNGFLWFASPWRNYLARIPLQQAFPDLANEKQSSRIKSENAAASNVKSEKAKRDTISTSSASTTSKPTPTPTPKPIDAPTISKPTTAPKPSSTPKDKPTTTDNNYAKPSDDKSTSTSANAEVKKKSTETVSDAKLNTKSKLPNAKSETDNKNEDVGKKNIKSRKNIKEEQDGSIKEKVQKSPPEKIKPVEAKRPRDDL